MLSWLGMDGKREKINKRGIHIFLEPCSVSIVGSRQSRQDMLS